MLSTFMKKYYDKITNELSKEKFAIRLNNVCDVAIKNKYGLVGIGD